MSVPIISSSPVARCSFDSSVGYQPPNAAPNDDGINFLSNLTAADVIEIPVTITYGPDEADEENLSAATVGSGGGTIEGQTAGEAAVIASTEYLQNILKQNELHATFKLKSMTRDFMSDYQIQLTDLKIPTGYDLEAT